MESSFDPTADSCTNNSNYDFHIQSDETTADNAAGYANCFFHYEDLSRSDEGEEHGTMDHDQTNDDKWAT